ncbi:MAG: hypothetical protein KKE00_02285, partial [Proteobacteria bacterium]|nr:hypothetical protein [Pseudomonadota bacterium]
MTDRKKTKSISAEDEKILEWIEAHKEDVIGFLQELIRIPSVNPWFNPKEGESREAEVQGVIK